MFPLDSVCLVFSNGPVEGKGIADPGVDDPHYHTWYEVLDKETNKSIGKMVELIRPVLKLYLV